MKILDIIKNKDKYLIRNDNDFNRMVLNAPTELYIIVSEIYANSVHQVLPDSYYIDEMLDLSKCLVDSPRMMLLHITRKPPYWVYVSSCYIDAHSFFSQDYSINKETFLSVPQSFYSNYLTYLSTLELWLSSKKRFRLPYEKTDSGLTKYTFFSIPHHEFNYTLLNPEYYHPKNNDIRDLIESSKITLKDIVSFKRTEELTTLKKNDITMINMFGLCDFNGTDGLLPRSPDPYSACIVRVKDESIDPLLLYSYLVSNTAKRIRMLLDCYITDLPIPHIFPEEIREKEKTYKTFFYLKPKERYSIEDFYLIEIPPQTQYLNLAKKYAEEIMTNYINESYLSCATSIRSLLELFVYNWLSEADPSGRNYHEKPLTKLNEKKEEIKYTLSDYINILWPNMKDPQRKKALYIKNMGNFTHPDKIINSGEEPDKESVDKCIDHMARLLIEKYNLL